MAIALSPNPTTSEVELTLLDQETNSNRQIRKVVVLDKNGLIKKKINGNLAKRMRLNISNLPADVYVVMVWDGKVWTSGQLVKR